MRGCDQRRWWVLALATEGSGRVEGSVASWCTYCNENTNALPSTSVVVAVGSCQHLLLHNLENTGLVFEKKAPTAIPTSSVCTKPAFHVAT